MHIHVHNHNHGHHHGALASMLRFSQGDEAAVIRRVVVIGLIANAILMTMKIATGYLGHSEALVADGFHSLNDFASDLVVLIFIGIAYRKSDVRYTYGYGKFETFVSLLISAILFIAAIAIFKEGVMSIIAVINGETIPHPDFLTIVVAVIAIAAKECLYRYMRFMGNKTQSTALVANAWHQRSDALASIATLLGVVCSHFFSDKWSILDPCASVFIAVFIAMAGIKMLIPAFRELMEHALPADITDEARKTISAIPGVEEIGELRSRKNGHFMIFDISIGVSANLTIDQGFAISEKIRNSLTDIFGERVMTTVTTYPTKAK